MFELITEQLGVKISTKYLINNKIPSAQRKILHDVTNTSIEALTTDQGSLISPSGGNPLDLEEVCNLTMIDKEMLSEKMNPTSCFFDYSAYKSLRPGELADAFSTYGEGTLFLIHGECENDLQLVAMFAGSSEESRRFLRVFTNRNPNMDVAVYRLQTVFMPAYSDVTVTYEAKYSFAFSEVHVEFSRPSGAVLLSPPNDLAVGQMTTRVTPYSTSSPLDLLKRDLDRIKTLSRAYQNETTWVPIEMANSGETESVLLRHHLTKGKYSIHGSSGVILSRDWDSTERVWEALKDVADRRSAYEGLLVALRFLKEDTGLFSVGPNNFTQFAKLARSSVAHQSTEPSHFDIQGLRVLLEMGVYKATNDCLALIHSVSPNLENAFTTSYLRGELNLERRLVLLHHLYKVACVSVALSTTVQPLVVEEEIRPLLRDVKASEMEFASVMGTEELQLGLECVCRVKFPLTQLTTKLSSFSPDLWVVRYSTDGPPKVEKRVVYECVSSPIDGRSVYLCHVLELAESLWCPLGSSTV